MRDDDTGPVIGERGPFVQFVALGECFADPLAERLVIRAGENPVSGKTGRWLAHVASMSAPRDRSMQVVQLGGDGRAEKVSLRSNP